MPRIDLTGQRFGRLTAICKHPDVRNKHATYICLCDCGAEVEKRYGRLRSGHVRSCGCLKPDAVGNHRRKHGGSAKGDPLCRLYSVWARMRRRCKSPNDPQWRYYGERGIRVCPEWGDYATFREWAVTNGYGADLSIDRIDVDGNYEPGNCRWADAITQNRNKRSVVKLTIGGVTATIPEHAEMAGLRRVTVYNRYRRGVPNERLLEPVG